MKEMKGGANERREMEQLMRRDERKNQREQNKISNKGREEEMQKEQDHTKSE